MGGGLGAHDDPDLARAQLRPAWSCMTVSARLGGLAHVVLPDSRGTLEQPGKYADTAILAA